MKKKKIAVIGGGIFGVTIASKLAEDFQVDLYEMQGDILKAASGINQFRIHRGYHYPRSSSTILSSMLGEKGFRKEYSSAIIDDTDNYYSIAKDNSLTSGKDYLNILAKYGLKHKTTKLDLVNDNVIDVTIKAQESLIDPKQLKKVAWKKMKKSKVNVLLNTKADIRLQSKYDHVVVCTYASINKHLTRYPDKQQDYQYELCEKILVKLPKDFDNKSIVVLDGPFMCIDPYGRSGLFLMGNVLHAIHKEHVGKYPKHHKKFSSLLNSGVIKDPPISNFRKFIESTELFIPKVKYAKYMGSMFTFRAVLPFKDKTDERPTLVTQVSDKIFTVFSGKIVTCVEAAEEVYKKIKKSS